MVTANRKWQTGLSWEVFSLQSIEPCRFCLRVAVFKNWFVPASFTSACVSQRLFSVSAVTPSFMKALGHWCWKNGCVLSAVGTHDTSSCCFSRYSFVIMVEKWAELKTQFLTHTEYITFFFIYTAENNPIKRNILSFCDIHLVFCSNVRRLMPLPLNMMLLVFESN